MLRQSNVPLILWRIHANRIEKKLVPDDRLRWDDQAHRPERPRDTAVARPCRGVPRQVRKSLSLRP